MPRPLLLLLMATACGGGSDPGDTSPPPAETGAPPVLGDHVFTLEWEGDTWTWLVYVPRADPTGRVIFLHGQGGDGPGFCDEVKARDHADRWGFVAVCPSAFTRYWTQPLDMERGFIDAMLQAMDSPDPGPEALPPIPPDRTFALGFSGGGTLVFKLACELDGPIHGFGAFASAWPPTDTIVTWPQACAPEEPRPLWNGLGDRDGIFTDPEANLQGWRDFSTGPLGCGATQEVASQEGDVTCWDHTQCPQVSAPGRTRYCTYAGWGHKWAGAGTDLDVTPAVVGFMGM